ncbi:MAG: sulfatase [Halofilum sp. (in: g-proteobacteria)]|nr:sulfatase [Halofilum sp. (in: g-proteobacteria)]
MAIAWLHRGLGGTAWLALDAVAVVGLLALSPRRRWTVAAGAAGGLAVAFVLLLALGDRLTALSLARPLDPWVDWRLLRPLFDLGAGQAGVSVSALAGIGVVALVMLFAFVAAVALARLPGSAGGARTRAVAGAMVAVAAIGMLARPLVAPRIDAPAWYLAVEQAERAWRTHRDATAFAARLAAAPNREPRALPTLAGVDVVVGFIESWGEAALTDPRYAGTVRPALDRAAAAIDAAGLHAASGLVRAPTRGGQSWLTHGTFLSGQWLDGQARYDRLLASGRSTLIDDFEATGHVSVAVMPAIDRPWDAADALGYDRLLDATNIDYAGPRLNWVTMPDQFTWTVVDRARAAEERPVFVETALISSHAPWVPVLPVLDWERIGDGRVFRRWADTGDSPSAVWRDPDRVRRQFARSLAYAVQVAGEYGARGVDADTLLILLGDHQPAPVITGPGASDRVPVHVISGDPALVEAFVERGFARGMRPTGTGTAPRMAALRTWLHDAFGRTERRATSLQ